MKMTSCCWPAIAAPSFCRCTRCHASPRTSWRVGISIRLLFVEGQPYLRSVSDGVYVDPLAALGLPRFNVEKRITKEICVWKPGMVDWQLAEFVPEALRLVALTPSLVPRGVMIPASRQL